MSKRINGRDYHCLCGFEVLARFEGEPRRTPFDFPQGKLRHTKENHAQNGLRETSGPSWFKVFPFLGETEPLPDLVSTVLYLMGVAVENEEFAAADCFGQQPGR